MRRLSIIVLILAGCSSAAPEHIAPSTSPSPAQPWAPPADAVPPPLPPRPPELPAGVTPQSHITLPQIIDIALMNNPNTRTAWLAARSAEAGIGIARSAYYPEVDVNVQATTVRGAGQGDNRPASLTSYGPSITLNYLLWDFGGRQAEVEQARQTLIAADFQHNRAIQDTILDVQQAYYGLLANKALLAAEEATLKEKQTSLDAAEARHNAGVATIADVLQARTAVSQSRLNLDTINGNLRAFEGSIATAMGLPATTDFNFGELPLDVPQTRTMGNIDALIAQAVATRPDLAASRAEAERARAHVTAVRSAYLPQVVTAANVGQTFVTGGGVSTTPYAATIGVRFPLFNGFRNTYDIRQARIDAETATEQARGVEQRVQLDVWTTYFAVQTASQRFTTSRDLLRSAQESVDAALGRYRGGVGSIIDLLTAEAALESARAQEVQARTDWFLSIAQLAHATGTLER
jgi:outer membrane protein